MRIAINPFYAAQHQPKASNSSTERSAIGRQADSTDKPLFARSPRAPITASPVPHLTSLYHNDRGRPLRRPAVPRQLLGQPDQGLAAVFPARHRASTR